MAAVVGEIMDGEATPAQIGALLAALRMKGETVDEVVGAARAMRGAHDAGAVRGRGAWSTPAARAATASRSINVSTIAAFVVAGAGVTVAKHGNRAQSSQSGAHDVIEALGSNPASPPELSVRCLQRGEAGVPVRAGASTPPPSTRRPARRRWASGRCSTCWGR